jgi:hypothetical protein
MPKDKTNKKKVKKRPKAKDDSAEEASGETQLAPVNFKIGEDVDNLKQREDWFQKRSGGKTE